MEEKCVAWGACGSASAKLVGQDEAETVNSLTTPIAHLCTQSGFLTGADGELAPLKPASPFIQRDRDEGPAASSDWEAASTKTMIRKGQRLNPAPYRPP